MVRGYVPLLLLLAAIWGASFMFIEIALDDLAPTTLMTARLAIAAVILTCVMIARYGRHTTVRELRNIGWAGFGLGVVNSALPFTLIAWGQEHIDSGVAAIANASTPIFVAVLAIRYRASERATGGRMAGIVLGLVGIAVLTGAQPEASWWAAAGTLAVVAASLAYGIGALLAQGRMARTGPLALSTAATIGATLALAPFGLAQLPGHWPSWGTVGAVSALGVAGTAVGMLLYFKIIDEYGSFRAGLVTYLLPVTALVYAAVLLDEPVTAWMLLGLVLILAGVAMGSGVVRAIRREPAASPQTP